MTKYICAECGDEWQSPLAAAECGEIDRKHELHANQVRNWAARHK